MVLRRVEQALREKIGQEVYTTSQIEQVINSLSIGFDCGKHGRVIIDYAKEHNLVVSLSPEEAASPPYYIPASSLDTLFNGIGVSLNQRQFEQGLYDFQEQFSE